MTVSVSPTNKRNTHHISLTQGSDTIGLILCNSEGEAEERAYRRDPLPNSVIKMFQGEQEYGDEAPPFSQTAQKNWGGGRGWEDADSDRTKYADDHRMNTTIDGEATVWGLETWGKGITGGGIVGHGWHGVGTASDGIIPTYKGIGLYSPTMVVAVPVTLTGTVTICRFYTYLKRVGTPANDLKVYIVADDGSGKPGEKSTSPSGATIVNDYFPTPYVWRLFSFTFSAIASASGNYWVVFENSGNSTNHWEILASEYSSEGHYKTTLTYSTPPTTWATSTNGSCYLRLTEALKPARVHHARLKWLDYIAMEYLDGSVSKVYQNGTGGLATSATASTLVDTNNTHLGTDDRWNRWVILLVGGKGADAPRPYRVISDCTGSTSTITIDANDPWDITPDNTTEYVIIGGNEWIEVTGHGLGAGEQIVDALPYNGAIYWACGDAVDLRRFRRFWSGGTYFQWTTESTAHNKATILRALGSGATGKIWKATRSRPSQVAVADGLDCTGTGSVGELSFGSAIGVGDLSERINGLAAYGEDTPLIHVLKEGSIHNLVDGSPLELRISELKSVMDPNNGAANLVHGSFLYFSYEDGLERYANNVIESVGPNLNAGLPSDRKGRIVQLVDYAGFILAVIDGGTDNYSSVLVFSGLGYCEIWRSPYKGMRIFNAWVQSMPGTIYNRLWINCHGDLLYVPIATNLGRSTWEAGVSVNESQVVNFAPGGYLITGYYYLSRKLLEKLWNKIGVVAEFDSTYAGSITVLYRKDTDTSWTKISNSFDSMAESAALSSSDVTGRRIQFLITIEPYYAAESPKLLATIVEALAIGEYRYRDSFTFRIADRDMQLDGITPDDKTGAQKFDYLNAWIASANTVTIRCYDGEIDNKKIKLDNFPVRILKHLRDENRNIYICQMSGYELS